MGNLNERPTNMNREIDNIVEVGEVWGLRTSDSSTRTGAGGGLARIKQKREREKKEKAKGKK